MWKCPRPIERLPMDVFIIPERFLAPYQHLCVVWLPRCSHYLLTKQRNVRYSCNVGLPIKYWLPSFWSLRSTCLLRTRLSSATGARKRATSAVKMYGWCCRFFLDAYPWCYQLDIFEDTIAQGTVMGKRHCVVQFDER